MYDHIDGDNVMIMVLMIKVWWCIIVEINGQTNALYAILESEDQQKVYIHIFFTTHMCKVQLFSQTAQYLHCSSISDELNNAIPSSLAILLATRWYIFHMFVHMIYIFIFLGKTES